MSRNSCRPFMLASFSTLLALSAAVSAADGEVDPAFGTGGTSVVAADGVETTALVAMDALVLPDGKLLFSGMRHHPLPDNPPFEPEIRGMLMRMNPDGSPDDTFGDIVGAGVDVLPDLVPGTRIQSLDAMVRNDDGSIVAVGTAVADAPTQGFIVKLDANGALDPSFGDGGAVRFPDFVLHALAIDADGRVVACGERELDYRRTSVVVRTLPDGAPDASFGDGGVVFIPWSDASKDGYLADVAIAADGGIIVGGRYAAYGPGVNSDFAIARLTPAGEPDPAFNANGWRVFHDESDTSMANGIDRLALLDDGRIVFAGYRVADSDGTRGAVLGRLTTDGAGDTDFGVQEHAGFLYIDMAGGTRSLDASALAIQADGKAVVSMTYFSSTERQQFAVLRATADGALDQGFADAGIFHADLAAGGEASASSDSRALALQADGGIIVAGRIVRSFDPPRTDMAAVRLLGGAGDEPIFVDGFDG
ncbi:hypothetical protein [Dokdonella fugitiva]|uniref:hypothetical protein n=1 Tax=Dokdonella fugitiva TaxID=328517 RepID=UPI0015F9F4ED|nr:hypothetical protein [Dokdonella fugitiva]MBA8885663.1 putative delta-60 repeat protein [Dokdonella fugitiva]